MASFSPRAVLYEELCQLSHAVTRAFPSATPDNTAPGLLACRPFRPCKDMVLEAAPEGMWWLNLPPKHWTWLSPGSPGPSATPSSLRFQARLSTQHGTTYGDQVAEADPAHPPLLPPGVRLWHANEEVRQTLLHVKHDLHELFQTQSGLAALPQHTHRGADGTTTLFVTPTQILGFREGLTVLHDTSPYLAKACREYAKIACLLYGLKMDEFAELTRMCISRHWGNTPVTLQAAGGGFYDSGPILTVGIGHPYILYDYSPSLMPRSVGFTHPHTPVRLKVAEGVMTVLDGYARSSYAHGYLPLPHEGGVVPYYTIDYHMDCMHSTQLIGYVKETGGVITHTPVIDEHVVQTQRLPVTGTRMHGVGHVLETIRKIRARLQTEASSSLLAQIRARQGW